MGISGLSKNLNGASVYVALLDDQSKRPVMTDPVLRMSQFDGITDDDVARMGAQIPLYNNEIQSRASSLGAATVDFFHTILFQDPQTLDADEVSRTSWPFTTLDGIP